MYNDYMYGVERNDEFLAHYGIRGMKWGVRKAIKSGNSARLSKQYAKASKKLAKLEKRAANSSKYAKRAAVLGAGAAAAGGLAAVGTTGVSKGIAKVGGGVMKVSKSAGYALTKVPGYSKASQSLHRQGVAMYRAGERGSELQKGFANASKAVNQWGKSTSISNAMIKANGKGMVALGNKGAGAKALGTANRNLAGVTNNTVARVAAGAVGAGLAAGAAKNAYRAATAKKKAAKFKSEMNKAFAGTKYANGGARQGKKRRK